MHDQQDCLEKNNSDHVVLFIRMLRTQQDTPPAKLDITIVATVLLFILFAASVRIIEIIARWVPKVHIPVVFLIFHFLDAIDSSGNPFMYLIVGYTRKEMDNDSVLQTFLERALLDEGDTAEGVTWAPGTK
nr:mas-related G-protein coupled receptor member B2-like isoform X5 [Pogona vitticeps]